MAYTKTITDANTYFTTSVKNNDWLSYTTTERTAALAQAKRELEAWLNHDLQDPSGSSNYRDDYGHFEQAMFLLDQTVFKRESETGAQRIVTVDSEQRDMTYDVTIAPKARVYFALPRRRINRG